VLVVVVVLEGVTSGALSRTRDRVRIKALDPFREDLEFFVVEVLQAKPCTSLTAL
jgi:hypothetical protein